VTNMTKASECAKDAQKITHSLPAWIKAWFQNTFDPPQLRQLRIDYSVFSEELDALETKHLGQSSTSSMPSWASSADHHLENVCRAIKARDIELGWLCLKASRGYALYGLDDEQLQIRAMMILNESEADGKGLSKWRLDTIRNLLKDENGKLKGVTPDTSGKLKKLTYDDVFEAKQILDVHQDNVYRKLSIVKSRLGWLNYIGMIFLIVWLFVLIPPVPALPITKTGSDGLALLSTGAVTFWWVIVLAGVLGGLISAFTSTIGGDIHKSNIPAELSSWTLTFSRLVVSALSALVITLFLSADVLSFKSLSYEMVISIAIVAGFTDRLLLSAIEKVVKPA